MTNWSIPEGWRDALASETAASYFSQLVAFVNGERAAGTVFPPESEVFRALELTPLARTRVVLIGQDPYHDDGQAHGLCFSVKPPTPPPPSLKNIFKELKTDVDCDAPNHGDLTGWAERGVLLLNAVLTVNAHQPGSHANHGWETFTDAIVRAVNARAEPAVFCLWGNYAKKKGKIVDRRRHAVVECGHPSPLSVRHFLGSKPFSRINDELMKLGQAPIDWTLS